MSEDDDLPPERTEEELGERHEREEAELEERACAHIEAAKASSKGKKAKEKVEAAERETEAWQYELQERQRAELERLQEHLSSGAGSAAVSAEPPKELAPERPPEVAAEADEAERIRQKKDKALSKRQGRAAKEAEKEAEKEREKLEAGPTARDLELQALRLQLAKSTPPLQVHEVTADGNCLYHAVAHQIRTAGPGLHEWRQSPEKAYEEMRALCAAALRARTDQYAAFAELKDGEDFEGYCARVESSCDWGGELELRALADELGARILVHRAEEREPLGLGPEPEGAPVLQVVFHRHLLSLGEHYNSVVPLKRG